MSGRRNCHGSLRLRRCHHRIRLRRERRCASRCGERLSGWRHGSSKRWNDESIPRTNWGLKDYVWFPAAEMYGIQRIEYLDDVLILCGAGVGGGSHVCGNTLYVPPKRFFDAPGWAGITDWADELAPCYDQARRMFGVVRYPYMPTDVDRHMQQVAHTRNDCVVPYYLQERKLRISIVRVDGHLYAFDDLCTCARESCPLSGGSAGGENDHVPVPRLPI
jgi:hypothetical protein